MVNYGEYSSVGSLEANTLNALMGHVPKEVINSHKIGSLEKEKILKISIMLQWKDTVELDQLILDLTNKQSKKFQKYLTQKEFYQRISPSIEQVNKVTSYLKEHNFVVESVTPNNLIIKASGTVEAINSIFHTEINEFESREGKKYYALTSFRLIQRLAKISECKIAEAQRNL